MRVISRPIRAWEELLAEFEHKRTHSDHWVFRGLPDAAKSELKPSLERCKEKYQIPGGDLFQIEGGLIRRFKRNYYHYSPDAPDEQAYIEWLSVMRHHGAPTRLLDWTYSVFIALFFALERSSTPAVIWALNSSHLDRELKRLKPDVFEALNTARNVPTMRQFKLTFGHEPPIAFVTAVNPYRLNQRLTVQQGTFLAAGDLSMSFEANLAQMIGSDPSESVILKLVVDNDFEFRKGVQQRLARMGISNAALFPGLDGFARSLEQWLNFPKRTLPPDTGYTAT